MITYKLGYRNSRTPLGMTLQQEQADGSFAATNLTSMTCKVFVTDKNGREVIAETTTGVSVVDAETGQISYTFPVGSSALRGGEYFLYVNVYNGSSIFDTFPSTEKDFKIIVSQPINTSL